MISRIIESSISPLLGGKKAIIIMGTRQVGLIESGNLKLNKVPQGSITDDMLLRYLDCAVIEALHDFNREKGYDEFDSVRAYC